MAQTAGYNYTSPGQYKGLMGGDYTALQGALQQPGETAANRAYQQGTAKLGNTFGGRGLYGSSMHAKQAQNMTQQWGDTLAGNASNAVTQRYNLENQDLQNQNNYGLKTTALENANEMGYNQLTYQKERDALDRYMQSFQMMQNGMLRSNSGGGDSGGFNWGGLMGGLGSLGGGLLSSL